MYNPKHNDRSFDLSHADNIHADMTPLNRYWDWKYGLRSHNEQQAAGKDYSFEATEREFYESQYSGFVAGQTQRNVKAGHAKRNRGIDEILADKRFCPEETLYQIGKDGDCPDPEILIAITTEFMEWMEQSFGSNVKILDWALHLDETSPHIHARQTFFYTNKYGETEPKQEKALECLGIPIKYPEKKPSKTNNRKVKFDEICRDKLLEICQQHGLAVETEAIYGGKVYLEKQDYIIESQRQKLEQQTAELDRLKALKEQQDAAMVDLEMETEQMQRQIAQLSTALTAQKEQLTIQTEALEIVTGNLTDKQQLLADVDIALDQIAGQAYDLAVADVTAKAVAETQAADRALINNQVKKIEADSRMKKAEKNLLVNWLTTCKDKIREGASIVLDRVRSSLTSHDSRRAGIEKIKASIKPSMRTMIQRLTEHSGMEKRKDKSHLQCR